MEQLWVVVEFLVTGELLRRQADEVLFVAATHKERPGDDVIIAERTVQRKAHQLAFVVQNNADVVIRERVGNIDQPADDFLLGFKGRLNVGLALYQIKEDNKALPIPDVFAPDGSQAYEALSGTRSRGVELEVAGQLRPGWQLVGSWSHNVTRDRDGERMRRRLGQGV